MLGRHRRKQARGVALQWRRDFIVGKKEIVQSKHRELDMPRKAFIPASHDEAPVQRRTTKRDNNSRCEKHTVSPFLKQKWVQSHDAYILHQIYIRADRRMTGSVAMADSVRGTAE